MSRGRAWRFTIDALVGAALGVVLCGALVATAYHAIARSHFG